MASKLYFFIFNIILSLGRAHQHLLDEQCAELQRGRGFLRPLERRDCVLRDDVLACTVRLMSESLPQNATATEYHSVVRVNLDYRFRFRVLPRTDDAADPEPGVSRACLVLFGVAYSRVKGGDGERRTKVAMPKRLFNLAANSALLGAESDLEPPGVPAGVVTFDERSCSEDHLREERDPAGCIREVGVSVVDVAAQLNLVLLSFNYSFAASGFPDRSGRGQSVVRNLPTDSLQSLRIRGGPADHQQQQHQQPKQQGVEPAEQQQHHAKGFPGVGANVTELDLSYSALGNLSTWEPGSDQIQRLALSHSDLESVPTFVQHQRGLRGLALDGNSALIKIGGGAALKEALTGLHHLQDLQLSGVQTEVLTVETLPSLPALALLNMSNCGLRHVSEGALALLPALQRLDLSANLLAVVPASLVVPCPRLRHLNLAANKLVRGPRLRLSLLHDLDISSNALQAVDDLVSEGRVVTLHLAHNNIRSLEGGRFASWAERVDVSHNLISALSVRAGRREVDGLVSINLAANPFDCDDCSIVETQMWMNETSVLLTPEPSQMLCSGKQGMRVMEVELPECAPNVDLALLVVAPVLALLALGAALLAVIGLRRAGWLGECSWCCGIEDDNDLP